MKDYDDRDLGWEGDELVPLSRHAYDDQSIAGRGADEDETTASQRDAERELKNEELTQRLPEIDVSIEDWNAYVAVELKGECTVTEYAARIGRDVSTVSTRLGQTWSKLFKAKRNNRRRDRLFMVGESSKVVTPLRHAVKDGRWGEFERLSEGLPDEAKSDPFYWLAQTQYFIHLERWQEAEEAVKCGFAFAPNAKVIAQLHVGWVQVLQKRGREYREAAYRECEVALQFDSNIWQPHANRLEMAALDEDLELGRHYMTELSGVWKRWKENDKSVCEECFEYLKEDPVFVVFYNETWWKTRMAKWDPDAVWRPIARAFVDAVKRSKVDGAATQGLVKAWEELDETRRAKCAEFLRENGVLEAFERTLRK